MRNRITSVLLICYLAIVMGCEKDDLKRCEAVAIASFEDKLVFENAKFANLNNETITISFSHFVNDSDISFEVSFWNIQPKVGTTNLVFQRVGGGLDVDKPSSFMSVIIDGDALAESYHTDSSAVSNNILTIDHISKNKVSGTFQVSYEIIDSNYLKYAPWVPDKFSLTEGAFRAID